LFQISTVYSPRLQLLTGGPKVARASLAVAYQAFRGLVVSMTRKIASCRPGLYHESFDSQRYCPTPAIHGPTGRTWIRPALARVMLFACQ